MAVPRSVAIIMDGNRRFAKDIMKRPEDGHEFGVKKAREVLEWADEYGIRCVTAYTLSLENINRRPKTELSMIYKYFEKEMDFIISGDHIVHSVKARVNFIGRLNMIPDRLQEKIKKIEEITKDYDRHVLNIAIAYGGQQEIIDACRKISDNIETGSLKKDQIDEEVFKNNLYMNESEYPDLIIRTGGERRLSNFLLWEAAYSELAFVDERWPELKKETFLNVLEDYNKRERRFGK